MTGQIVEIRWVDTRHQADDSTKGEAEKLSPVPFTSYGVLLVDNAEKITIACNCYLEDEGEHKGEIGYRDVVAIPRGCVVKVIKLEEV